MNEIPAAIPIKPGYRAQSSDTTPEADALEFWLLRQRSNSDRWQMAAQLIRWTKKLSLQGVRKSRPSDANRYFAQALLGDKWIPRLTPTTQETAMWVQDPSAIARLLHPIFERFSIAYYITGGVAAILYGEPRTTRDLDVVVNLQRNQISSLAVALETAGFYCPPSAIEEIEAGRGQSISVTHMATILNADLVLTDDTPFDRSKMARRQLESLGGTERYWVASAEDIVLAKLVWRQRSQSQKQWRDVLGILKIQGQGLSLDYLFHWAAQLGITGDLSQALVEAGL